MKLKAVHSPFTTFCEGPENIENGYKLFYLFHKKNYFNRIPKDKNTNILVISSGVGYFQYSLKKWGYSNVLGIDSDSKKIAYAKEKGFNSEEGNCFEFLKDKENKFDLIFAEQEINHLTIEEVLIFLKLCYQALKPEGKLIINAANSANPFISTEYLGNNIDHFTSFTENNLRQCFSLVPFKKPVVFCHDFYVLWYNPLNYVAKAITSSIHLLLFILFKLYGKSNKLFTKRIGVMAEK